MNGPILFGGAKALSLKRGPGRPAPLSASTITATLQVTMTLSTPTSAKNAASRAATGDSPAAKAGGTSRSEYDVFISYAHKQDREVRAFVEALQKRHPRLRIFYDRRAIPIGGQWLKAISDAVHKASTFIAVLSPDYTASPVCWDEFQCAKLKEYNTRASVIKTVRLYSEPALPPIMGIYSFADCAEGDLAKLRSCAATLLSA